MLEFGGGAAGSTPTVPFAGTPGGGCTGATADGSGLALYGPKNGSGALPLVPADSMLEQPARQAFRQKTGC